MFFLEKRLTKRLCLFMDCKKSIFLLEIGFSNDLLKNTDCFEVYPYSTTSSFTKKEHTTDKVGQSFLSKEKAMAQLSNIRSSMPFM